MALPLSRLPLSDSRPTATQPAAPRPRPLRTRAFEHLWRTALTPLQEARALDARALVALPLVTVLELEVPGWAGPVWVRGEDGRGQGQDPILDRAAWLAVVDAAEQERLHAADFRALVAALAADPSLEVTRWLASTLGETSREATPAWTVGRVLERVGAKLFSVRVEAPPSSAPVLAEAS